MATPAITPHRDWNSEFQSVLELDASNEVNQIIKTGHMHELLSEFAKEACTTAIQIICAQQCVQITLTDSDHLRPDASKGGIAGGRL